MLRECYASVLRFGREEEDRVMFCDCERVVALYCVMGSLTPCGNSGK